MASRHATDRLLDEVLLPKLAEKMEGAIRVLNVGVLCGNSTRVLTKRHFPARRYETLDRDATLGPDHCADIQRRGALAGLAGRYDLILVTAVFYLLDRPCDAFDNLLDCLRPGGHLIIEMDAFNARGKRFYFESYTKDLDQSRYLADQVISSSHFRSRYAVFAERYGRQMTRVDYPTLAIQLDGKSNATVWRIDHILGSSDLESEIHFNDDPERPLGCSFLLDVCRMGKGPVSPTERRHIVKAYQPGVTRLRHWIQLCLRGLYRVKLLLKSMGLRKPA